MEKREARLAFLITPLLIAPVLIYNLYALTVGGGLLGAHVGKSLAAPLLTLTTAGGGTWPISASDLILALGLIILFVELIKGQASRRLAMVNEGLSVCIFIACVAELLLVPGCATSTFFLLTLMVLLDVAAGFLALRAAPAATPAPDIRRATTTSSD